jgi:hypothetical protein
VGSRIPLTVDDVRRLVGDVDELVASAILATGASEREIAEALAWIRADEELEGRSPSAGGRAGRVQHILQEAFERLEDEGREAH